MSRITGMEPEHARKPCDRIRQYSDSSDSAPLPHAATHPWPVLDALNRTYRCTALPEGGGIVLYPAAGLTAWEKADALRFARDNLPLLLKDLCLEHLPRRVRLESGRKEGIGRGAV